MSEDIQSQKKWEKGLEKERQKNPAHKTKQKPAHKKKPPGTLKKNPRHTKKISPSTNTEKNKTEKTEKICAGFFEKNDFWLHIGAIFPKFDIGTFWPKIAPSVKVTRVARGNLALKWPQRAHPYELWSDPCGAWLAAGLKLLRLPRAQASYGYSPPCTFPLNCIGFIVVLFRRQTKLNFAICMT